MKRNSIWSPRLAYLAKLFFIAPAIALMLAALSSQARAACKEGCDNQKNTFLGESALIKNTSGTDNVAIGFHALLSNTTGAFNVGVGFGALFANTTGIRNVGVGQYALKGNTTGNSNVGIGQSALSLNVTGGANVGVGDFALTSNNSGNFNVGIGDMALSQNATGSLNTAIGAFALGGNSVGENNTAAGAHAMNGNSFGSNNTANGAEALLNNRNGSNNTANGFESLFNNTIGHDNIALGANAGSSLTTGDSNIDIGNPGLAGESYTIRIGRIETQTAAFIAGINGTAVVGSTVVVDENGQLGTLASAVRFKNEIRPMGQTSEIVLGLKPVSFHYKSDPKGTPQFGLIAEEVAQVDRDLVLRDHQGEIYSVRYEAVNAMLLNEFLKEHKRVEEQGRMIAQQQEEFRSVIAAQEKRMAALTLQIQQVSKQLETARNAPPSVESQ
jgi:hypothetical protein